MTFSVIASAAKQSIAHRNDELNNQQTFN